MAMFWKDLQSCFVAYGGLALLLIYPFLFLKPELLSVVCSQRALAYIHIYTHSRQFATKLL